METLKPVSIGAVASIPIILFTYVKYYDKGRDFNDDRVNCLISGCIGVISGLVCFYTL